MCQLLWSRMRASLRRWRGIAVVLVLVAALAGWSTAVAPEPARAAVAPTVVSFTFDDGDVDQLAAEQVLNRYGMKGTFFIISGAVGQPGYFSRADLDALAASGQEIGGHTVSHLNLADVPLAEARRQVCMSRETLSRWGFHVTSFAYPDGAFTSAVEAVVRDCGFNSARAVGGLAAPIGRCPDCAPVESVPPADPYAVRSSGEVDTSWTLADLEQVVTTAERHGGGWVPLVFHHVCASGCGSLAINTATFDSFATWLAQRQSLGTVVRTVNDVVGGRVRPVVGAAAAAPHGVVNPSLETLRTSNPMNPAYESVNATNAPEVCWTEGGYGTHTLQWQRTSDAHSGGAAERLTITSYTNGQAVLLPQFDLGTCSLPVTEGTSYELGTWYESSARTQFVVYDRSSSGQWSFWTASPYLAPAAQWTHATWKTPAVPSGASGLSFGLALFSTGSLTTDDYSIQGGALPTAASGSGSGIPWYVVALLGVALVALVALALFLGQSWRGRARSVGPPQNPPLQGERTRGERTRGARTGHSTGS